MRSTTLSQVCSRASPRPIPDIDRIEDIAPRRTHALVIERAARYRAGPDRSARSTPPPTRRNSQLQDTSGQRSPCASPCRHASCDTRWRYLETARASARMLLAADLDRHILGAAVDQPTHSNALVLDSSHPECANMRRIDRDRFGDVRLPILVIGMVDQDAQLVCDLARDTR